MSGDMRYLLDTDFISETRKLRPDPGVVSFLKSNDPDSGFISVLTLGELRKGVAAKKLRDPDPHEAARLAAWVDGLESSFADRILSIDTATAKLWGEWSRERPRPVVDAFLVATAVLNDLILVTRNIRDVRVGWCSSALQDAGRRAENGRSRFAVSHPFQDETVERMGHLAPAPSNGSPPGWSGI